MKNKKLKTQTKNVKIIIGKNIFMVFHLCFLIFIFSFLFTVNFNA